MFQPTAHRPALYIGTAALIALGSTVPAHASDATYVCPPEQSGFITWDVSTQPYQFDNAVDEKGNGDGLVCAKPGGVYILNDGTPFQLYNFIDNHVVIP
jgi:hypothetical protein